MGNIFEGGAQGTLPISEGRPWAGMPRRPNCIYRQQPAAEILQAAGAKDVQITGKYPVPGFCIHELGTARVGSDSKNSVLNRYAQAWDVDNIFVTDGAAWVSSGCANPTLTMMALTVRACDYIVKEYSKKLA